MKVIVEERQSSGSCRSVYPVLRAARPREMPWQVGCHHVLLPRPDIHPLEYSRSAVSAEHWLACGVDTAEIEQAINTVQNLRYLRACTFRRDLTIAVSVSTTFT